MATRAPINPGTLIWAREVSHITVEELASVLGVKPGRVAEFEDGDALTHSWCAVG